jgi:hypothetical protein
MMPVEINQTTHNTMGDATMKKPLQILWILSLLVSLAVVGCKKDDVTGTTSDAAPAGVTNEQSAMKYFAQNDEFVNNDEVAFADKSIAPTDYDESFAKTDASITPLRWGRFVTSVTRTVTVTTQPGDSLSSARIDRTIVGVLKIKTISSTGDTVTISKDFQDKSVKNVIFKRVAHDTKRYWLNWVPVATSLVTGGTNPVPANEGINITKLELTAGDTTVTVTDPLATWLRYRWLKLFNGGKADVPVLTPGSMVTIKATVQSQSADSDIVVLRHGFGHGSGHFKRLRMTMTSQSGPDGSGFYTRTYEKQVPIRIYPGMFHFGVDAVTRATLFDDVAPYSVSWWGIPYRVF